jgi:phage/plasmid-like protein (TIGR03299 family)
MAHELTLRANGRAEMAYVGDTPWHGLGQALPAGASLDTWLHAAGMDWTIQRSRVRYPTTHLPTDPTAEDCAHYVTGLRAIADRHVLLRSDTQAPLGIVSDRYKIVQPREVLEFFRDLTASAGFALETAGTLFGGSRFWALARIMADTAVRDRRDTVGGFLLLCTSADGSLATEGRFTTVRVVCNNTLGFARAAKCDVRVSHKTKFDAAEVKRELGVSPERVRDEFESTMEGFRTMAATPLDWQTAVELFGTLAKPDFAELDSADKRKVLETRPVTRMGDLFTRRRMRGADYDGAGQTVWGWLNAVTEYVDHHAQAHSADNRLDSALFGRGDTLKARALDLARAAALI